MTSRSRGAVAQGMTVETGTMGVVGSLTRQPNQVILGMETTSGRGAMVEITEMIGKETTEGTTEMSNGRRAEEGTATMAGRRAGNAAIESGLTSLGFPLWAVAEEPCHRMAAVRSNKARPGSPCSR
mmetsp:Transcript_100465/g.178253  ORF Transcript_100465/g.178253 Transcript_100465/m.178253 type:complete len:126 (+) Transcript_100465:1345-1722(+)